MVGVSGVSSAVEREGRTPAPCLWASCAGATAARIREPFVVGVDGVSFVGWERPAPALCLCLWASCAETATELATELYGPPPRSRDSPQRLYCLLHLVHLHLII